MKARKGRTVEALLKTAAVLAAVLLFAAAGGCAGAQGSGQAAGDEEAAAMKAQQLKEAREPAIGLILTSEDAEENEAVVSAFEEAAKAAGAKLYVRIPEVSFEEAEEAAGLTDSFVLCEVDPIEYQMLYVNELVAENVDVIAIHANHSEALTPVLAAARAVGIRVCAFGLEVGEESCDVYADTGEAAEVAAALLEE